MKVKCMKPYTDLVLGRKVEYGEILEVTEERGEELTTPNNKSGYILCARVAEPKKAEEVQEVVEEAQEVAQEVQEVAQEVAEEVQEVVEEAQEEVQKVAEEVEEAPVKKTRKKKEV